MLLVTKLQWKCCQRYASALPKAMPNKDELHSIKSVEASRVKNLLFESPLKTLNVEGVKKPKIEHLELKKVPSHLHNEWRRIGTDGLLKDYLQLSKHRLTMLITATTISGYMISTAPFSIPTFLACVGGTALLSSSANACNHLLEVPYDAQMKRTQSRVLVIHRITPLHALGFATVTATAGLGLLCVGCSPLTSGLGFLNLVLYAAVYTPMKRYHIGCTWIGAIVGAIPPLMGYTATTGSMDLAALTLAAILYSWQFPHFNGLSWNLRADYSRAGYHVMCVTNEELCRKTTLRHAIALLGICSIIAPLTHLADITFALDSIPLNLAMLYFSYKFYRQPDAENAKKLFRLSLFYLPMIMMLLVISSNCSPHTSKHPKELPRYPL